MVLYNVYSDYHRIKHYSTVCSKATLFQVVIYAAIIIAPFFISYATNDLWQYTSTYTEQPEVNFINQWIIQVNTDNSPVSKVWSTYAGLNRLLQDEPGINSEIAIPLVKFREDDYNFDRKNDKLTLIVNYDQLEYNITAVQAILLFELKFKSFASVVMQSLVHISSSWSLPSSRLWVTGDLVLYQRDPLPSSGRVTTYNTSFFNDSSFSAQDYELTNIIRENHQRNITTNLKNRYSIWEGGTSGNFTLQVEITYPTQTVIYTPGFWQVIKFAWVQYLAILVVFYVVLGWVQDFVFQNQIILTVKHRTDKKLHRH